MLTDLIIQFFGATPRRAPAVYLLLTGKKTLSVLFAALQHQQLQWLQLYPTLARADFQDAVKQLVAAGTLRETDQGLVLVDQAAQRQAAQAVPLPPAYQATMGLPEFERRLLLAVQVVSEAQFGNRRYRPVVAEWGTQQAVRRWLTHTPSATFVTELTAAFAALPQAVADRLAQRLVGHEFVGAAQVSSLGQSMQAIDDLAQLVTVVQTTRPATLLNLWGGPVALLPASAAMVCQRFDQGENPAQIAQRLHLRPSTVNEHLLGATIFGWQPALTGLYSPALKAALDGQRGSTPYQTLLAAVPGSDFFQVRLFQILDLQGRWPRD